MKRCPKCSRTYPDDNQKFCTVDGGRLESADNTTPGELGATIITNQADLSLPPSAPAPDLNKTMASMPPPPTGEIRSTDTGPTANRTIVASFQPAENPLTPQPPPSSPAQPPQAYPPQQPPDYKPQPPPSYQQPPPQYQQQQPPPQQYQQPYQQPQAAPPSAQMPPAQQHVPAASPAGHAQPSAQPAKPAARKGSRVPLILGAVVLVLLLAGGAAYYFLVLNKKSGAGANTNANANVASANTNANSNANVSANTNGNANASANANTNVAPPYVPPPDTTQFVNSSANLDGKLAEHFVDFSFYYPDSWKLDPKSGTSGATSFVVVERKLPPDFTQERLAVTWYQSKGTYAADKSLFPNLVEAASSKLEKLPGYEKVSEGPTKVNSMDAYEFRFKGLTENTEKGDITFWGRIIFLPPGVEGRENGLQLSILTSSLAPELEDIEDVGVKGELPVVLESFRLK